MKLSVELYSVAAKFGDHKAIELIKQAGFDAIDFSYYYERENEEILGEDYRKYAEEMKEQLDLTGIVCNQAHASFTFKYGMNKDTSVPEYLHIIRALESAAILGAENIVVHSVDVPDDVDFEAYNIEYYRSFIPYCEAFNIHVAVENLFTRDTKRNRIIGKIGSPRELNSIVKKINSPWIVACVDVGHASLTGYEPEAFVSRVDPQILKCLHVQDNDYLGDRHTLPYLANLNWNAIMTSLKKSGYTGDLTLEIVTYLKRFPNELIPDALKFAAVIGKYLISIYENA